MKPTLTQGLLLALVVTQVPVAIQTAIPLWDQYVREPLRQRENDIRFEALLKKRCSPEARKAEAASFKNLPDNPWHKTTEGKVFLRRLEEMYGEETPEQCATRLRLESAAQGQ